MPTYSYKARDGTGKLVSGSMDAPSKVIIADKLSKMGYLVTSILEVRPGIKLKGIEDKLKRIKSEDIIMFNIQLANMVNSGLTLLGSMRALIKQIENKKLREVVEDVYRSVEGGSSLSESMEKHPKIFSSLFTSMIKAGEASGNLDVVLNRLAVFAEHDANLRQNIKAALIYPVILTVVGMAVVIFLVTFVIPQFVVVFTRAGVSLPMPTTVVYGMGQTIKNFWYLIILAMALIIFGVRMFIKTESGRLKFDRFKFKITVLGSLFRKVSISRFSRTLATLVASGVPILQSLSIIEKIVGNKVIARVIKNVHDRVREGERIAEPLKMSEEFPPDTIQMIAVGEESGNLDGMLNKIADFYDMAVGYTIKKLTALLEPVFLVIMGGVVGFIMASVLLPMFDMVKAMRR